MDANLSEEYFDKAISQFRLTVGGILEPLIKYGQEDYVQMIVPEIVSLAYQLYLKLSGVDEPYLLSDHIKFMIR